MMLLLHTLIGLLFFAPITWYCLRHWLLYWRHPLTHLKLLGYYLGNSDLELGPYWEAKAAYEQLIGTNPAAPHAATCN